jgi:hypothetical protein
MMASIMDVLDPAGDTAIHAKVLARRPATLAGATIGVLDNSKPNARVLLERVAQGLRERFGAREVRTWRKPTSSSGAIPSLLDEMAATCTVALTASAD